MLLILGAAAAKGRRCTTNWLKLLSGLLAGYKPRGCHKISSVLCGRLQKFVYNTAINFLCNVTVLVCVIKSPLNIVVLAYSSQDYRLANTITTLFYCKGSVLKIKPHRVRGDLRIPSRYVLVASSILMYYILQ